MKTLPANLILSKNALASTDPWILLLEVTIPTDPVQTLRIARNTEDVTFQGNVYTAFSFEIDTVTESSKGELPSVSIRVSNVNQMMQSYIEEYDGLISQPVKLIVVNAQYLTEDYSELELNFDITACQATATWVTWKIGAPNPLARRFPLYRYIGMHCNWVGHFKGAECKYAGTATTCAGTLDDCDAKDNLANFGGYPGLAQGGIRVV